MGASGFTALAFPVEDSFAVDFKVAKNVAGFKFSSILTIFLVIYCGGDFCIKDFLSWVLNVIPLDSNSLFNVCSCCFCTWDTRFNINHS